MPAAVAKGIILSISVITAISIAVLENPQVQAWLEDQRKKVAEWLRSFGEELDPESRRKAEAFAFEGRTPATDPGLRREASGSEKATAVATGRSLSDASLGTVRKIPIESPVDPDVAEERRRKGREYLAQRTQRMHELQQKRKAAKAVGADNPPSPTSFDALVDDEGKLRRRESEKELPSPPTINPVPEKIREEMREVEHTFVQPLLVGGSDLSLVNPFGDEYACDRSDTPKPPVPPKVALDHAEQPPTIIDENPSTPSIVSHSPRRPSEREPAQRIAQTHDELSYEEQLAIAVSLSETDCNASTSSPMDVDEEDAELKAAIAASLRDVEERRKVEAAQQAASSPAPVDLEPLVDLSPSNSTIPTPHPVRRLPNDWEAIFGRHTVQETSSQTPATPKEDDDSDELYRMTPVQIHARPATMVSPPLPLSSRPSFTLPYDPVRDATQNQFPEPAPPSLYGSAVSSLSSPPPPSGPGSTRSHTLEAEEPLIDVSFDPAPLPQRRPTSNPSSGFITDSDSETDVDMELPAPSRPRGPIRLASDAASSSSVEVVDLVPDVDTSDIDMVSLSDGDDDDGEGDGILTPDSWTEVGSHDGESESETEMGDREMVDREQGV